MSHLHDAYGHSVTNADAASIEALNTFGQEWISYGPDLAVLFKAASNNPACATANAYAALLHMSLEAAAGYRAAEPFLNAMGKNQVTPREIQLILAADAWSKKDYAAALSAFERAVELAPTDIVAAKWGQYLAFNLGDAAAMLRLAKHIMPHHRQTAEAWGMLAFAQEQSHQLHLAEDSAKEALSLNADEAWAQHALAHVYETHGRLDEGIDLLTRAAPGWTLRSIFMKEHNYWHLALFRMDQDDYRAPLEIFDKELWGAWPEFAQEQIGAISMLWRLELRGVDVGNRWQPVIAKVKERGHEHIWPFHDMHYVYALAKSDDARDADSFLSSLKTHAERSHGVWSEIALPMATALIAFVRGNHAQSNLLIAPLFSKLHQIGGSHAQRDIFVQTWIEAAFKSDNRSALRQLLQERSRARPKIAAHRRDLERFGQA